MPTLMTLTRRGPRAAALVVACLLAAARPPAAPADDAAAFFEKEVRPTLVEVCQGCHGPKKQQGGLRLDSRAAVLAGGGSGPAMVPGQPEASRLVAAVRRTGELKMPPSRPLPERQVAALVRWVELGAPWPASPPPATAGVAGVNHWAFRPVRDVAVPAVRDAGWARTPLDRFVRARLEAEGLTPSPEADRRTLIRRLSYDLTGLPPSPAEVEAFTRDERPDAYERLVERLLASPHHGEQWGRHWLDVARYSDTKGYVYGREERVWVHAWAYRDWVIGALNRDLPYDRFLALQLAADQLAAGHPDDLPALGYLTLGRRFLGVTHDIIDDRIDVTTRGLMGLTVACARCHDHKYDPVPTEDYYSLYGVFRSCSERLVPVSAKAQGGDAAFAKGLAERQKKLADTLATRRAEAAGRARGRVGDYLRAQLELHNYPEEGFDQVLAPGDLIPATVRRWRDYLARAAARRDPVFAPWHAFGRLPREQFARQAPGVCWAMADAPANGPAEVAPPVARAFATPPRDMAEVASRYGELFARVEKAWQAALAEAGKAKKPAPVGLPDPGDEALRQVLYGPDCPCEVPDEPIVDSESYFPTSAIEELWKLQGEVDRWLINAPAAPPYATVLVDRTVPTDARVLRRGNPATPGEVVPRQFLGALAGPARQPFREGSGRLELARAITDPANPLTARVLVNRVWLHHFGAGLVRTPSDFGTRAEPPSHPELLDWLARRFVADGWSLKSLHRQIALSSAYRQSSAGPIDPDARARATARDPDNRLLWRMNSRRLSFEELRDSLYATAGGLDRRGGGKPADLLAPPFAARRSVYGLIDRQFFPDLLRTFDVANPDLHIPQRSDTTVPQQALFFLNHPLLLERARALAGHPTVAAAATPGEKVARLYRLLYQREPTASQVAAALALVPATGDESRPSPRPSAWSYGVAPFDPGAGKLGPFRPLPHFTGDAWQGAEAWPDPAFGWAQLTAAGGHPGNDLAHAVVRRWTAPADLTAQVEGTLVHDVDAGDGIRATVLGSRAGVLKTALVHNGTAEITVPRVALKAGDTLDFVVDIRQVLNSDQYTWAPVVREIRPDGAEGKAWRAREEFGGPPRARPGAWEQLAQALLMVNEFSFVD